MVTKTRCAGGDESDAMELGSTGGQEAGMEVDAPICVEARAAPDALADKAAAAQKGWAPPSQYSPQALLEQGGPVLLLSCLLRQRVERLACS